MSAARPFLAPEQLAGDAPDPRADVYSLGAIARELMRCAHGTAPPILHSLVTSMLATNVDERPTSAQVLDTTAWLTRQVDDAVPRELDLERTEPVSF
jgi:serine/threonine protein kinase